MWLRFAVHFRIPVRELQARLTSSDFNELVAFYRLEPFGDLRDDERAKMVSQTIANFAATTKRAFKRSAFQVIDEDRERRLKTPLLERWKQFVALHNKAVANGNDS